MEIIIKINIAEEFSDTPGAREDKDGHFPGDDFFIRFLKPNFDYAVKNNGLLLVDLDGCEGFPSSFISASFGRLSTEYGAETVFKYLIFKSNESPFQIEKINNEIRNPRKKKI